MPKNNSKEIDKKQIEKILRVDHAGELGAVYICKGQKIFSSNKNVLDEIENNEKEHLKFFSDEMVKNSVSVSIFYPIWKIGSFALGAISSALKKEDECTFAVESVIENHYDSQIKILENDSIQNQELLSKIKKFREEESHHKEIAMVNVVNKKSCFIKAVKFIVKTAIKCSSKI